MRCESADTMKVTVARGPLKRALTWHRSDADLGGERAVDSQDPERPPPTDEKPAGEKWWESLSLIVGPGIRGEKLADDAAKNEMAFDFVIVRRRGGGGLRSGLGLFGGGGRRDGLAPTLKLSLRPRNTEAVDTFDPGATSFGTVKLRPMMAGVVWSRTIRPKWSAELMGVAGYSFNAFDESEEGEVAGDTARVVLPSSVATIENSFAWELSAKLWYDLHPRVAVTTGLSFLRARPELTLTDGSRRTWNGDRLSVEAGVAIRLFGRR
jgi:hypothetical protein